MNNKYNLLVEEIAETPFGKCSIRLVQYKKATLGKKYCGINLEKDLFPEETKWSSTPLFYSFIKVTIQALIKEHGKSEVEKELGIKIK